MHQDLQHCAIVCLPWIFHFASRMKNLEIFPCGISQNKEIKKIFWDRGKFVYQRRVNCLLASLTVRDLKKTPTTTTYLKSTMSSTPALLPTLLNFHKQSHYSSDCNFPQFSTIFPSTLSTIYLVCGNEIFIKFDVCQFSLLHDSKNTLNRECVCVCECVFILGILFIPSRKKKHKFIHLNPI